MIRLRSLWLPLFMVLVILAVASSAGWSGAPSALAHAQAAVPAAPGATTFTVLADADATIKYGSPDSNFGGADAALDLQYAGGGRAISCILLHFNLSASLPSGATIDSAQLEVRLNSGAGMSFVTVAAYTVNENWGETSVTWNTGPEMVDPIVEARVGTTQGWVTWDATAIARTWQSGRNYGLELCGPQSDADWYRTFTNRHLGEAQPRLVVTYSVPATTPTATGTAMPTPTPTSTAFAPVTFRGYVLYGQRAGVAAAGDDAAQPDAVAQPDVPLSLVGIQGGRALTLDTTVSGRDGSYQLAAQSGGFSGYEVRLGQARGLAPHNLKAPASGQVLDPSVVFYPGTSAGDICCADFTLVDPGLFMPTTGPRYLIVTRKAVVDGHALDDFVAYKRFLGYNMLVRTVEELGGTGNVLRDNIRAYEKQLLAESAGLKYVLLIGTDASIPFFKSNPFDRDIYFAPSKAFTDICGYEPTGPNTCGWPSDWYYVDLTSNWDSNGDSVLGESFWPDPKTSAVKRDQPPAFHPSVYVGRLQMDDDAVLIKKVLATIMAFERDGGNWKGNTLIAAAMSNYDSIGWEPADDPNGKYNMEAGAKTDNGVSMEMMWTDLLQPQGFTRVRLYEKFHLAGHPEPSSYPVDAALTYENLAAQWQARDYGLIKLAAHGGTEGVSRLIWDTEYIADDQVEQPTKPICWPSCTSGTAKKSYYELNFTDFVNMTSAAPPPTLTGKPALITVNACSTGNAYRPNNFPNWLFSNGRIAGWIGALAMGSYVNGWSKLSDGLDETVDYLITRALVTDGLPVGDAFWTGMETYNDYGIEDLNTFDWDLYGDPSMHYWGNGADLRAPWPMYQANWAGTGETGLTAPQAAMAVWNAGIATTPTGQWVPSPVVGRNGRIYIGDAAGTLWAFDPEGALTWSYQAGTAPLVHAPALALDGTVYVKSRLGSLYAIAEGGALKWTASPGDGGGAPKVGGDGRVYVGGSDNEGPGGSKRYYLAAYRPDGMRFGFHLVDAAITTAPAIGSDGSVWVGTAAGTLYRMAHNLSTAVSDAITPGYAIGAGLAIASDAGQTVLAPSAQNRLVAWNPSTRQVRWTFDAGGSIAGAPAVTADGTVFVGTNAGRVYSLRLSDGGVLWQFDAGGPVASAPAVDPTSVLVVGPDPDDPARAALLRLRRGDGGLVWAIALGGGAGMGSSPAIAESSRVYVASRNGKLFQVGPLKWKLGPFLYYKLFEKTIQIEIDPIDELSNILLERRNPGDGWNEVAILSPGQVVFNDAAVQPGEVYEYRALALSAEAGAAGAPSADEESSDYSAILTVQAPPEPPGPPSAPTVTALSSTELKLTWTLADSRAISLTVIREGSTGTAQFTLPGNATSMTDRDLQPDSRYAYSLRAGNETGGSLPGPSGSGRTRSLDLSAPSQVAVEQVRGQLIVCWKPASTELAVEVARRASGELTPLIVADLPAGNTCFTDSGLPSYYYEYLVRHVSGNRESEWARSSIASYGSAPTLRRSLYLPLIAR